MPKAYESMKAKFMADGMTTDAAQGKAARIYNAKRKPGAKAVSGREQQRARQAKKGRKTPKHRVSDHDFDY